jgi:hypothetical protein
MTKDRLKDMSMNDPSLNEQLKDCTFLQQRVVETSIGGNITALEIIATRSEKKIIGWEF